MSYHEIKICKHEIGSPFKLEEEVHEYLDAVGSNNPIMAVQELSDIYGAIEIEAKKYGITMENIKTMSDLTKSVFESGKRSSISLLEDIRANNTKIGLIDGVPIAIMPSNFAYMFFKEAREFSDDMFNNSLIIETIKGECLMGSIEGGELISRKIIICNKNDANFYISSNTIVKVKVFNGRFNIAELEIDDEYAMRLIEEIYNSKKEST